MGGDSNAIIMNNELCLFPQRLRGKCDDRRCPPVTGGILEQLAQDEHRPLFIGIDGTIQFLRCHLNAALNQQRSMIFNRLGSNFSQIYLSKQAVLFRVLRTGVEQGSLYVGLDLCQFCDQLPAGLPVQVPADEPGGGDRSLDFMHPLFHILPVLPLLSLCVGHSSGHSPSRPAGQVKEPPFIKIFGRRDAFNKQIFPIQSLQNGFQFQQAGTLLKEIERIHTRENHQKREQQN